MDLTQLFSSHQSPAWQEQLRNLGEARSEIAREQSLRPEQARISLLPQSLAPLPADEITLTLAVRHLRALGVSDRTISDLGGASAFEIANLASGGLAGSSSESCLRSSLANLINMTRGAIALGVSDTDTWWCESPGRRRLSRAKIFYSDRSYPDRAGAERYDETFTDAVLALQSQAVSVLTMNGAFFVECSLNELNRNVAFRIAPHHSRLAMLTGGRLSQR